MTNEEARLYHNLALDTLDIPNVTKIGKVIWRHLSHYKSTVFTIGCGGSAAHAQHFAAELTGRFQQDRRGYPGQALTADGATITAIANDYGWENVFKRQLEALGKPGDMLVSFSTSGRSPAIVEAMSHARNTLQMTTLAIIGDRESAAIGEAKHVIRAPSLDTAIIQELHTVIVHMLCRTIDDQHFQQK